ncbi:MAG: c-type cytochrome [Proteobacteria bacterium]|nr:c-type cytochrome [Pseudomonadota bacterium]
MRSVMERALCHAAVMLLAGACVTTASLAVAAESARTELDAALRSRPNLDHGAELFRNCAVCHGSNGEGTLDGGVARIAGQHAAVIAKQLVDYRHDRRWDIRMEHFADQHHLVDPQSIIDVASYVHGLSAGVAPGVGDGELAQHGSELYAGRCSGCHGPEGEGNAQKWIPRIAGQHYEYLMRQIYDAVDGRRPNMSRAHVKMFAKLDRDDIVGLSDFLSRLGSRPTAPEAVAPTR